MKLKDIESIVRNDKLSYKELLYLYIEYLKLIKKFTDYMPSYKRDLRYYNINDFTNCYAYALRLRMPSYFNYAFYYINDFFNFIPGVFSNMSYPMNSKELLNNVYSDLDILEFKLDDNNYSNKVALFEEILYTEEPDFHFNRLNDDNTWSYKQGYTPIVYKDNYLKEIDNYELVKVLTFK